MGTCRALKALAFFLLLFTDVSSQWQKLPLPPSGIATIDNNGIIQCNGQLVSVPREAVPFGFGKIFYSSSCAQSHGQRTRLLLSNDDFVTGTIKQSTEPVYGHAGLYGLSAYNDSTFTWFYGKGGYPEAFITFNSFKTIQTLGISGNYSTPTVDLTKNYFYSLIPEGKDSFYIYRAKPGTSGYSYHKSGGYNCEIFKMKFANDSTGYMIMTAGTNTMVNVLLKTSNYGRNWFPVFSDSAKGIVDFHLTSTGDIYVLKKNGDIFYNPAGIFVFSQIAVAPNAGCVTIHSLDQKTWLVGSQNGVLLKTTDAGTTWIAETTGTTERIDRIYNFANTCYFVTISKAVYKSLTPVGIKLPSLSLELKVFPNPSNNVFKIELPEQEMYEGTSKVAVYDLLGKKIMGKEFELTSTEISLANVSEGVYILHVRSGDLEKRVKLQKVD